MNRFAYFSIFILFTLYTQTDALQCYACTWKEDDLDQYCVTNPEKVTSGSKVVKCNKEYCTIRRQEYKDPEDQLKSFYRGCESNPPMNSQDDQGPYTTFYRACKQDLCNSGDGKDSSSTNNNNNGDGFGVLLVPGIGAGIRNVLSPILIPLLMLQFLL